MFINLSNHLSRDFLKEQKMEAEKFGKIIDIPFPSIDATFDLEEVDDLAEEYFQKILQYENPVVMLQGEFVFTYRLLKRLENAGIRVVASCTERKVTEWKEDGKIIKNAEFEFVQFRDYIGRESFVR